MVWLKDKEERKRVDIYTLAFLSQMASSLSLMTPQLESTGYCPTPS